VEVNAAHFMSPQNKVSKASVGFRKKIFAECVIKCSVWGLCVYGSDFVPAECYKHIA